VLDAEVAQVALLVQFTQAAGGEILNLETV
jgi:hypothetical protein